MIEFRSSAKFDKQALLVCLTQSQIKQKKYPVSIASVEKAIDEVAGAGQFKAERGQLFPLVVQKKLVLLAGLGEKDDLSLTKLRIKVRKALLSSFLSETKSVEIITHDNDDEVIKAVIEAVKIGTYSWDQHKKKKATKVAYALVAAKKKIYEDASAICDGTNLTRDLVNGNADDVTSTYLEKVIKSIVKNNKNVTLEILNKKELKAKGLHLHLAVNQGSLNEPKLIIAKYKGDPKSKKFTAIVGKGMTYDTGGLNLKPTGYIETMKMDMGGAAAVIGALKNTVTLKLKKNVIFACGIAENCTSAGAYKPGDVITGYAGKSVEIANTDAEGRLVLADAISYLIKNYKPERLIDVATLTGACIVALGHNYTALVTTDDKFSRALIHSSNDTDDRAWRLPMYPELKDSVKSQIADIRNLGYPKGAGGTITAAEFLRQFANGTTWAHLDIAGTAYVENGGRLYFGFGATGAGVRLLTNYLQNN